MHPLIETHRHQIRELAARRGAKRIRVFGSMATGGAEADSDVDFLVEMEAGSSAFTLGALLLDLEELLGRRIDLTTPSALHPALRSRILREAVDV